MTVLRPVGRRSEWCQISSLFQSSSRSFHVTPRNNASRNPPANEPATASMSPRWLSEVKHRIGKTIMFGLKPPQVQEAGSILEAMARDWRELVAGSEGFLTSPQRRGLYRQAVVWGEMDSMVRRYSGAPPVSIRRIAS